jgi:cyanophycin synthetase
MRLESPARPWVFCHRPDAPAVRQVLNEGGRATTLIDGWISVIDSRGDAYGLVPVIDVPMTLAGISRFNVENAMAAASAALGVGLPREAVVDGLRSFSPDPELNPGRMNVYSLNGTTVVIDLAHNEAGLEALLEIGRGLRPKGSRLLLVAGTAGDRTDDVLRGIGEIGARGSDVMVVAHKAKYLRGRRLEDMDRLFKAGAEAVGVTGIESYGSELDAIRALVTAAEPGDVVAVMCQAQRPKIDAWLRRHGATVDDPGTLRSKVIAAATPHPTD